MLEQLQLKNPHIRIYSINDLQFSVFGRVLDARAFQSAIEYLEAYTSVPTSGNQYVAHDPNMEKAISNHSAYKDVFGGLPIQFGYVNGHNQLMDALEYHKTSEINIAASSFVILVGIQEDIEMLEYDSAALKAFYVPKGTAFELYPTTLHFSPFEVANTGFKCAVILPFGTNVDAIKARKLQTSEDQLLFKTNKWLLCHDECTRFKALGAVGRVTGSNIKLIY